MKLSEEVVETKRILKQAADKNYTIGVYYDKDGEHIYFSNGEFILSLIKAYERRGLKLLEFIEGEVKK